MYIDIHTHNKESSADLSVFNTIISKDTPIEGINSVGGHPWYLRGYQLESLIEAMNHNTIAIGECGLDKIRGVNMKKQIEIFEKQVYLAQRLKLPLIIHCVRAYNEVMHIIEERECTQHVIIHGYKRNSVFAKQLIDKDYYLSFGADLLTRSETRKAFKVAYEAGRFFLETDMSDSTIEEIYRVAANVVRRKVEIIQEKCIENFSLVFKKDVHELAGKN